MDERLKQTKGKLRYGLIPEEALEEYARVATIGAEKYEPNGWRKGIPFSVIKDAMLRHLHAFFSGEDYAPDDKQHHMASVMFWAGALIYFQKHERLDLDDRDPMKVELISRVSALKRWDICWLHSDNQYECSGRRAKVWALIDKLEKELDG